jgi:hypothetical protein
MNAGRDNLRCCSLGTDPQLDKAACGFPDRSLARLFLGKPVGPSGGQFRVD